MSEHKPVKKFRAGRFQISIWSFRRLLTNGSKDSTAYLEQWVDVERACIQYSTYNKITRQWANQTIWCSLDDLRSLAQVVERLNEEDSSSISSSDSSESDENESRKNEVRGIFPAERGKIPNEEEMR